MVECTLLLALAAAQTAPSSAPTQRFQELVTQAFQDGLAKPLEAPRPYRQLETMRRMLHRQIEANRGEILSGKDDPETKGAVGGTGTDATWRADSMSGPVMNALVGAYSAASVGKSGAEYVPGLAAVFSLSVPVRAEWIEERSDDESEAVPAKKKRSDDDDEWEAVARGAKTDSRWTVLDRAAYEQQMRGFARVATRRQRFDPAAVEALKSTLLDTVWRFGHKLELSRGERLAVVVEVQPASRPHERWSQYGEALRFYERAATLDPAAPGADPANAAVESDPFGGWVAAPAASFRMVIQVSADDLAAYRDGQLDRDDLAKRTRVQTFAGPTASASAGEGAK